MLPIFVGVGGATWTTGLLADYLAPATGHRGQPNQQLEKSQ